MVPLTVVERPGSAVSARDAAKDLICQIVAAAGGSLNYAARLHKAFYFAHLYFFEEEGYFSTAYPVVHTAHGPAIHELDKLIDELVAGGRLLCQEHQYWQGHEYSYSTEEQPPTDKTTRGEVIHRAAQKVKGMGAKELSDWVHEHSRSWREGKSGQSLNIYLDLLDEADWGALKRSAIQSEREILEAFGAAPEP